MDGGGRPGLSSGPFGPPHETGWPARWVPVPRPRHYLVAADRLGGCQGRSIPDEASVGEDHAGRLRPLVARADQADLMTAFPQGERARRTSDVVVQLEHRRGVLETSGHLGKHGLTCGNAESGCRTMLADWASNGSPADPFEGSKSQDQDRVSGAHVLPAAPPSSDGLMKRVTRSRARSTVE